MIHHSVCVCEENNTSTSNKHEFTFYLILDAPYWQKLGLHNISFRKQIIEKYTDVLHRINNILNKADD